VRHLILLLPFMLAACATTGSSGGQITIEAAANGLPVSDVRCVVSQNNNTWEITPPATIAVGGAFGDLRIVCDRQGYRTSEMVLRPSGPYGSSVGLGVGGGSGNVGVGVGFSVPVIIGGGEYPSRVTVNLNPQ